MKNLLLVLLSMFLLTASGSAQSNIKMKGDYGGKSIELQGYFFFEGIALEKMSFTGSELKNKNYQIFVKKYVNGKLAQTDMVFDSTPVSWFKIDNDPFVFYVFAKRYMNDTVKFEFQFNGFRNGKEYKVTKNQKDLVLKDFMGAQREQAISLNGSNTILTFMMPYVKKDGGMAYCDVVQSGVAPEELGKKYSIPLYFLIDIKFLQ